MSMIALDLDNTLVELSRSVATLLGRHDKATDPEFPRQYDWSKELGVSNDELWKIADEAGPEWWANLPWTSWGEQLLQVARKTGKDVIVLSVVVGPSAAAGKRLWANKHLPRGVPLFTTDGPKWPLAGPGRILIDDAPKNIESWEANGGDAILVPQTYNDNRNLVGREYEFITKELWALDFLSET